MFLSLHPSFKDSSNQRLKVSLVFLTHWGFLPLTSKSIFWFPFLFLSERLLDILGLNFILAQIICLSIRLNILGVKNSLDERILVSSMNTFTGGSWNPPSNSTISALFSVAFRSSCIARTKSIGETEHLTSIPN